MTVPANPCDETSKLEPPPRTNQGSPTRFGDRAQPLELERRNSAFWQVTRVEFVLDTPSTSPVVAASIGEWLRWLADRGAERLWLFAEPPDRHPWGILTALGGNQVLWSRTDSGTIEHDPTAMRASATRPALSVFTTAATMAIEITR